MADLNFIKLATDATFAVGPQGGLVEAAAIYLVRPARRLGILGGMRTYTLSPTITFAGPAGGATPVDGSETSVDGFAGFTFRPLGREVNLQGGRKR